MEKRILPNNATNFFYVKCDQKVDICMVSDTLTWLHACLCPAHEEDRSASACGPFSCALPPRDPLRPCMHGHASFPSRHQRKVIMDVCCFWRARELTLRKELACMKPLRRNNSIWTNWNAKYFYGLPLTPIPSAGPRIWPYSKLVVTTLLNHV